MLERRPDFLAPDITEKKYRKLSIQDRYKLICNAFSHVEPDINMSKEESIVVSIRDFAILYGNKQAKIYKIASTFGKQLSRASLNINKKYIFDHFKAPYCCIEFGIDLPLEGNIARTVYVCFKGLNPKGDPVICLLVPKAKEINEPDYFQHLVFNFDGNPENDLDSMIENKEIGDEWPVVVSYILKCLLYISSAEPDLSPNRYHKIKTENHKKINRQLQDECILDLVQVGYSFHGKHRYVESTTRRAHPRWQPYGPGREKVKLIWIDETEVNYKPAVKGKV